MSSMVLLAAILCALCGIRGSHRLERAGHVAAEAGAACLYRFMAVGGTVVMIYIIMFARS